MARCNPEEWTAPNWHPDFGDPSADLKILKTVALILLSKSTLVNVQLECVEDGYMSLMTSLPGIPVEVLVVEGDAPPCGRRVAVFAGASGSEVEQYFDSPEMAADYIIAMLPATSS